MPGALSPAVELRLRLVNWPDDHAAAIVSDRGMYLGYVSAERALLIGKPSLHPDPLRRWRSCPTPSPMFRNAPHPAWLGLRIDGCTIPPRVLSR